MLEMKLFNFVQIIRLIAVSYKCPTHLNHKMPHSHVSIVFNFTLHVCAKIFHIMNIYVGV